MWRIDVGQIQGREIRPAPIGTEAHNMPCLVYEAPPEYSVRFSVVTKNGELLTAKTIEGLKGVATQAGLVWTERLYMP
jgi:hypothetical protein